MGPERAQASLISMVAAVLLSVGACAPNTRLITDAPLLPPPPEADLRPVSPPELTPAAPSEPGDVADYPALISNLLAVELASIFGLPDGAGSLVQAGESEPLVPILDAVAGEIIIPMLFDALDQREQILLADARPRISLGNRENLYRLIINVAMARVWQTAAGDATGRAAYLTHLATRSTGRDADNFLAWRGIDGAVWRQRIRTNLQPAERPFVVLGVLTSHYLHTHIFSITGYLIARSFADALIDHRIGSEDGAQAPQLDVDALAAELMDRAKLPLLGIDSLFTIAAEWAEHAGPAAPEGVAQPVFAASAAAKPGPCASSRFFQAADKHLIDGKAGTERRAGQAYVERIEASLRDQEHVVARHMSAFLPGQAGSPIRFAGFDVITWKALVREPAGCARTQHVAKAAAIPRREIVTAKSGDRTCEAVLLHAHILADDRLHASLCAQIERMFPNGARNLLLANLAGGRLSAAERSALAVGLALLPDATPRSSIRHHQP